MGNMMTNWPSHRSYVTWHHHRFIVAPMCK